MTKYFDKTDNDIKSLEVSFVGMEWTDNGKEIPKTAEVIIRLLERPTWNVSWQTPYKESWKKIYTNILIPTGVWNGMKLGQLTDNRIFVALGISVCELNLADGIINWTESYANTSIVLIKLTRNNDALFILYSYYKFDSNKINSNLIKVDLTGNLIWSAETKDKDDKFTIFNYESNGLSASTWNGWTLKLSEETGNIIESHWSK